MKDEGYHPTSKFSFDEEQDVLGESDEEDQLELISAAYS